MDSTKHDPVDWNGVSEEMARQIFQQGETYMQAQLAIAVAADQRAITAASIFAATAVAVLGVTLAYWATKPDLPILLAGLAATFTMTFGASLGF